MNKSGEIASVPGGLTKTTLGQAGTLFEVPDWERTEGFEGCVCMSFNFVSRHNMIKEPFSVLVHFSCP